MKTEDIDKKIGMPNVDAEWARFEREVINKESARPKRVAAWAAGIGIAASIALMLVVGLQDQTRTQPPLPSPLRGGSGYLTRTEGEASSLTHSTSPFDGARKTEQDVPAGVVREGEQEKRASDIDVENLQDDSEGTSWSTPLDQQLAGLTIVSSSSSLGPGNTMRLGGTCIKDSDRIEGRDIVGIDVLLYLHLGRPLATDACLLGPSHNRVHLLGRHRFPLRFMPFPATGRRQFRLTTQNVTAEPIVLTKECLHHVDDILHSVHPLGWLENNFFVFFH